MSLPVRILALTREEGGKGPRSIESNCELYARRIGLHAGFNPDVIVLPELGTSLQVEAAYRDLAEPTGGTSMRFFQRLAKEQRSYVVGSFLLQADATDARKGCGYIAATLIDRQGQCVGTYRKTYPTGSEYTIGAVPGPQNQQVLQTDFGPVGLAICFDIGYDEIWAQYGRQGAKIVFWPSAYAGGELLNAHAVLNGYYIVTATHPPKMRVIDPMGRTLHECRDDERALTAVLNLDEEYVHMDYANKVLDQILDKYGKTLSVETNREIGWYRFQRTGEGPTLEEILKEFKLVPCRKYLAQSRQDIDRQRASGDAPRYESGW